MPGRDVFFREGIDEAGRLVRGAGPLEFARMRELLGRFLPAAPGVVLDVWAGAVCVLAGGERL